MFLPGMQMLISIYCQKSVVLIPLKTLVENRCRKDFASSFAKDLLWVSSKSRFYMQPMLRQEIYHVYQVQTQDIPHILLQDKMMRENIKRKIRIISVWKNTGNPFQVLIIISFWAIPFSNKIESGLILNEPGKFSLE